MERARVCVLWLRSRCGPMVLDALLKIKNEQDPTLTFRRCVTLLTHDASRCSNEAIVCIRLQLVP